MDIPLFNLVEFSTTELCNRKCQFCPRYKDVYPNRDLHMSLELFEKIINDLADISYKDNICFSGFGEPMMYKHIFKAVGIARRCLPAAKIYLYSNGDFFDVDVMNDLYDIGIDVLRISIYDKKMIHRFQDMVEELGLDDDKIKLRVRCLPREDNFGLIISNRGGNVDESFCPPLDKPMVKRCYYPFYMLYVDFDGHVLLCPHDWGKYFVVGDLNVESVMDVWCSDRMNMVRHRLNSMDRDFQPCNVCNVNGMMDGQKKYEAWQLYNVVNYKS